MISTLNAGAGGPAAKPGATNVHLFIQHRYHCKTCRGPIKSTAACDGFFDRLLHGVPSLS